MRRWQYRTLSKSGFISRAGFILECRRHAAFPGPFMHYAKSEYEGANERTVWTRSWFVVQPNELDVTYWSAGLHLKLY